MDDKNKRQWFKRGDMVVLGALIIVAMAMLFLFRLTSQGAEVKAVISLNGEIVHEIELNGAKDAVFRLSKNENVSFQLENGKIRFVNISCPDKLCENFGYLEKAGDMAVCLPNKVILKLVSQNGSSAELDAIVN